MTKDTGKRPDGAAAAILAVSPPRIDANASRKGGLSAAVLPPPVLSCVSRADSPLKQPFSFYWRPKSSAQSAHSVGHFRSSGTDQGFFDPQSGIGLPVLCWDGIFWWEGCGIVECCCVSGSLAYSRIMYEQMSSNISTLTRSPVRKFSRRFAPGGLSIRGYFCVFGPFAYLRIPGFPIPDLK